MAKRKDTHLTPTPHYLPRGIPSQPLSPSSFSLLFLRKIGLIPHYSRSDLSRDRSSGGSRWIQRRICTTQEGSRPRRKRISTVKVTPATEKMKMTMVMTLATILLTMILTTLQPMCGGTRCDCRFGVPVGNLVVYLLRLAGL